MADYYRWNDLSTEIKQAVSGALLDGAEHLLHKAGEHCPHDTGALEGSGLVTVDGDKACISYDTPYAVKCHEHPTMRFHGKGRGKWLETAIRNNNDQVLEYMKNRLSDVMR